MFKNKLTKLRNNTYTNILYSLEKHISINKMAANFTALQFIYEALFARMIYSTPSLCGVAIGRFHFEKLPF